MDEVLKALDQENERLYQDSRTQQDSPVSAWSTIELVYPYRNYIHMYKSPH